MRTHIFVGNEVTLKDGTDVVILEIDRKGRRAFVEPESLDCRWVSFDDIKV